MKENLEFFKRAKMLARKEKKNLNVNINYNININEPSSAPEIISSDIGIKPPKNAERLTNGTVSIRTQNQMISSAQQIQ
jgi:hypothetical protein